MQLYGKPPARNTIHQEVVVIRQVLKAAVRHSGLKMMPDLSEPYKKSGKISHRAWLAPDEYKRLYQATRERAQNPKRVRYAWESEQLHDFILFMVNTGLRPDEAWRLQFRDVKVAHDDGLKKPFWRSKCGASAASVTAKACRGRFSPSNACRNDCDR
ncbi:hypothetical protein [Bradyrhizobium sp. S3.2.12]